MRKKKESLPLESKSFFRSKARFKVTKKALFWDWLMNWVVVIGGVGVIASIMGIFFFILFQIYPLFQKAKIQFKTKIALENSWKPVFIGIDEWNELPFFVKESGSFVFYDLTGKRDSFTLYPFEEKKIQIKAFSYKQQEQSFIIANHQNQIFFGKIDYVVNFEENKRVVDAKVVLDNFFSIGNVKGGPIKQVSYGSVDEEYQLVATLKETALGKQKLYLTSFTKGDGFSLFDESGFEIEEQKEMSSLIEGHIEKILVRQQADRVIVITEEGVVYVLSLEEGMIQTFKPFLNLKDSSIVFGDFIFGDYSLVFFSKEGDNIIYSLYAREDQDNKQLYGHTKTLAKFSKGNVNFYAKSLRNKAYIIGSKNYFSLRYATTEKIILEKKLPFKVSKVLIGSKYNSLCFLDELSQFHLYRLKDPHPQTSFKTFFKPIWYEGAPKPSYDWQSSGSSEEYEPKLSMIPLIWGSLKGTFFSLIFSVPIALFSALYVSQFLHPKLRTYIKSIMELMASIPSVVLGFLGALYVAPLIVDRVVSLILMGVLIPSLFVLVSYLWVEKLPLSFRIFFRRGYDLAFFLVLILTLIYFCWLVGPALEKVFFVFENESGEKIASFRQWWVQVLGFPYEQRNSLIVGFMMGFCVVPIIFTISEDAFSSVPKNLKAGAFALGASEWQCATQVVLPVAFGGVFSSIMIGFGRAIGETMIVLMATGNTPIIDFNIFTGMRTLSANIAVELPEAPQYSTLYRSLFLGAFLLFLFTFVINTVAEILRQKMRGKYYQL